MDELSSALSILTAMITPAVLISASGTLILSTSNRLGEVIERVRYLSDNFEQLVKLETNQRLAEKKIAMIFHQLDFLTVRSRLLQRGLTILYLSVGVLVAASVAIGAMEIASHEYAWVPVLLGITGACFLFYASVLLVFEGRLAVRSVHQEMNFVWEKGQYLAPPELLDQYRAKHILLNELPWLETRSRK
jgi:hypothetical protein